MKAKFWQLTVCFLLSSIFGFTLSYVAFVKPLRLELMDRSVGMCESDLKTLSNLRRGEDVDLINRKERLLPIYAGMLSESLPMHPGSQYFLWQIREYYRTYSNGIPEEITNYFRGLPESKPTPPRLMYSEPRSY